MTTSSGHAAGPGRTEGRAEGKAEGIDTGRALTLLTLLEAKFGALGDAVQTRVRTAGTADLETWTLRILTADTLADVLD